MTRARDLLGAVALQASGETLLVRAGMRPDLWQRRLLRRRRRRLLLLSSRQAGKSSAVAAYALHRAIVQDGATVLVLAPTQRQSTELVAKTRSLLRAAHMPPRRDAATSIALRNGSRVIALPANPASIRTYAADLIVVDEAAFVPDPVIEAARPMLAVTHGDLVCLSTPNGQTGWFYDAWQSGVGWERIEAHWRDCPRIDPEFIASERAALPAARFAAEYELRFLDRAGAVFSAELVAAALAATDDDTPLPVITPLAAGGMPAD